VSGIEKRASAVHPEGAFVGFAAVVALFHHLSPLIGPRVDLATPFFVVGAAAVVLFVLGARTPALALGLVASVAYVDGHGIHLAADAVHSRHPTGEALEVADFWDERFGHIEKHLGWIGLLAAFCLAEALRPKRPIVLSPAALVTVALVGFTFFTSTVEGGTWWLAIAGAVVFGTWALRRPGPLLAACAAGFLLASLLIGIWAIWHGGVPQFSDVGIILRNSLEPKGSET
jgi:hypothetical protein